jgi:PhzF family phenazine biosynthesis protein
MPTLPLYQVDAFSDYAFAGNPAAVCMLDHTRPDVWMQNLASEMKHSETAFLLEEDGGYRLRWFTPGGEVDLCGHATLASAHILFSSGRVKTDSVIRFFTRSGELKARLNDGWIELNFPVTAATAAPPPENMLPALGIEKALFIGKNDYDFLVVVDDENLVRNLKPDFRLLKTIPIRGVVVTARSSGNFDFISRFFAPYYEIDEDPVTGSAHCTLTPYWSEKLGKTSFNAYQASARGGVLKTRLEGDRVVIAGQAVTIYEAKLNV